MDASGFWTISCDAPRPDIACLRYYGPATRSVQAVSIALTWSGPNELSIQIAGPRLDWVVYMDETPLRNLNLISRQLPFWSWRYGPLLKVRGWIAGLLGLGEIRLAGQMPSGHFGALMPQEIFFVNRSRANLDGDDLGAPTSAQPNPAIGGFLLPARGIFAIGQARWVIRDPQEYAATRRALGVLD